MHAKQAISTRKIKEQLKRALLLGIESQPSNERAKLAETIRKANEKEIKEAAEQLINEIRGIKELPERQADEVGPVFPVGILRNRKISALEAISVYLHDKGMPLKSIAKATNRSPVTINISYHKAKKKMLHKGAEQSGVRQSKKSAGKSGNKDEVYMPLSILAERKLSVLESIVEFLLSKNLKIHDVSRYINRDYMTVWTCHRRALLKSRVKSKKGRM